jgi:4-hydroxy 2-oxovalerate aldolase
VTGRGATVEAAAENISRARLTTLLLPGVGTIEALKHAYALGVRSVRVATHCTVGTKYLSR